MYFDTTNYFLNKKNDVFLSILVHLKKKLVFATVFLISIIILILVNNNLNKQRYPHD